MREEKQSKRSSSQKPKKPVLTSKEIHQLLMGCAKKRFPNDNRNHGKFCDVAQKIVKGDQIKASLDYLQSNDFDIA